MSASPTQVVTTVVGFAFVGVEKLSVSFDLELGEAIRASANERSQSVSGWLADAARDRLRLEALGDAIQAWEQRFGSLSDAEVDDAERLLQSADRKRRRRGAA
jgi:hypothetical protein